ncbi:MAG: hypothetical protein PHT12_03295 [Patescibacteria group bacterium]|nr:hypothetical protein [Patescibacteria group bacterium]
MKITIGKKVIRQSQLKRIVWIAITALAAVAMVIGMAAPAFMGGN